MLKKLFTAALFAPYAHIINDVYQQREKVNTLPNIRSSKDVELIVYDDFKGFNNEIDDALFPEIKGFIPGLLNNKGFFNNN